MNLRQRLADCKTEQINLHEDSKRQAQRIVDQERLMQKFQFLIPKTLGYIRTTMTLDKISLEKDTRQIRGYEQISSCHASGEKMQNATTSTTSSEF